MLIRAGYRIALECEQKTPLLALISVHPSRVRDLRSPAVIRSSGPAPLIASLDEFGNVRTRTVAPFGTLELSTNFVIEDSRRILMARGRDAADCAITTSFGKARLSRFEVVTEELSPTSSRHFRAA
jgi:hypothetical protein